MFEKATRMKLRFPTAMGSLSVEDIWDLPLLPNRNQVCLDDLAKALNRELKSGDQESFVLKKTEPNEEMSLRFEIIKHVISVRLDEQERAENAAKTRAKKQDILRIIAEKETESLKGQSLDELKAILSSL